MLPPEFCSYHWKVKDFKNSLNNSVYKMTFDALKQLEEYSNQLIWKDLRA